MIIYRFDYIQQVDNWISLLSIVFAYLYIGHPPVDEFKEKEMKQYLSMAFFFVTTNLILQFANLKKQLRLTWIIIERSFIAVMKYMIIPILLVINFTFSKTMVGDYTLSFTDRFKTKIAQEYQ